MLLALVDKANQGHKGFSDNSPHKLCFSALGGCISYLKDLFLDTELIPQGRFQHYDSIGFNSNTLILDSKTLKNLEIFENNFDGGVDGTLYKVMNHCLTPFGKRLLKKWLSCPLKKISEIDDRLNAVEDLNNCDYSSTLRDKIIGALKGLPDLERMASRIHAGTAQIKTFLDALDAFARIWVSCMLFISPSAFHMSWCS